MQLNFKKNKSLAGLSGMPNVSATLTGWEVPLTLTRITQSIVDGDAVLTETKINFQGCFQPLRDEELQFKPDGQRSWKWVWIHAKAGTLNLNTADKIIFNGTRYKIMGVKDYSLNGYIQYEAIEDFQEVGEIEG